MFRPKTLLLFLLIVLLLCAVGCNDAQIAQMQEGVEILEQRIPDAQEALATAAAQSENLNAAIAMMPDGELKESLIKIKAQSDAVVIQAMAFLEKAEPRLAELKASLAEATDTLDVVDAGIRSAAPLIPAPWGSLLLGGWSIFATIRAAMNRRAARQVVKSVEPIVSKAVTSADEEYNIRTIQGPTGNRIVDEAQRKKFALPL